MRPIPLVSGPLLLFLLPAGPVLAESPASEQGARTLRFVYGVEIGPLGPEQRSGTLDSLVYAHVELAGRVWKGPIQKSFRYQDVSAEEVASR